ncbi:hypothetical protein [uncultured Campylobacter sp.]|nr:hypothetical protein [uncultured Campylobacter sp.]
MRLTEFYSVSAGFRRGKTDHREIEFYKISSTAEPNKILNSMA